MLIDKWDRKKVGEERKVKEKQGGGEKQGEGAQGSRREAVCFQTISYIVESFTVQKVLLYKIIAYSCVHFLLMVKQLGICMQAV